MGYDAYSYTVYGFKTTKGNILGVKKVRNCKHTEAEGNNFCPQCGKETYSEEEVELLEPSESGKLSYFSSTYESNDIVVGFRLGSSSYNNDIYQVKPIHPDMIEEILNFCESIELDFPAKKEDLNVFGILHHSY